MVLLLSGFVKVVAEKNRKYLEERHDKKLKRISGDWNQDYLFTK